MSKTSVRNLLPTIRVGVEQLYEVKPDIFGYLTVTLIIDGVFVHHYDVVHFVCEEGKTLCITKYE